MFSGKNLTDVSKVSVSSVVSLVEHSSSFTRIVFSFSTATLVKTALLHRRHFSRFFFCLAELPSASPLQHVTYKFT